jgi:hypothetical protein
MEALVPPAVASLRAHLGDGDPAAWRAGLRVLELAYGPAPTPSPAEVLLPECADDVGNLGWRELQVIAARLIAEIPAADIESAAAVPVLTTGNGWE